MHFTKCYNKQTWKQEIELYGLLTFPTFLLFRSYERLLIYFVVIFAAYMYVCMYAMGSTKVGPFIILRPCATNSLLAFALK
jgi:peptidoglycan/LPS O-acetylase OafA/YrhL